MSNLPATVPTPNTPANESAAYKAEIAAISGITISDSGTTQSELQTELDSGIAKVVVNADITTTSKLIVPSGVVLVINRNSTIECTANAHVIEIKPGSFVTGGGTVYNSNAASTSACLFLDGSTDTFTRLGMRAGADELYLKGAGIGKGQGLYLYVDSTAESIHRVEWCHFSDLNISHVEDGIRLECNEENGSNETSYINGNFFSKTGMEFFHYGIRTVLTGAGGPSISGNAYIDTKMQYNVGNISMVVEAGVTNTYLGLRVYDFAATTALSFTGAQNYVQVAGVTHDEVSAVVTNTIASTSLPETKPFLSNASVQAIDATLFESGLVYNSTRECLAVATSKGWKYERGAYGEVAATVGLAVNIGYSGMMINNDGATGSALHNLSAPVIGEEHMFRKTVAQTFRVNPVDGTLFEGQADGKYKFLDDIGSYLHVRCYTPNIWTIIAEAGITNEA